MTTVSCQRLRPKPKSSWTLLIVSQLISTSSKNLISSTFWIYPESSRFSPHHCCHPGLGQVWSQQSRVNMVLLKGGGILPFLGSRPSSDWMVLCRVTARVLYHGLRDLADLPPSWRLIPRLSFPPLFPLFQMHWLPCCFSNTPGTVSSQGLCMCCSLCLKCSSSKPQSSLPYLFEVLLEYRLLNGAFPGQPL